MQNTIIVFLMVILAGCQNQDKPRQYTEVTNDQIEIAVPPAQEMGPDNASKNPHEGMDIGKALAPQAKQELEKLVASGKDPHAGIDMSAFQGKDPHAGMDMAGMQDKGAHAGMDMSSSMMGMEAAPDSSNFIWNLPNGWKQGPNKGMRVASFYIEKSPSAIDCSIVSLGGAAGGLEGNLSRWLGQLGVDGSSSNVQQLISSAENIKTNTNLQASVYDLSGLQKDASAKSMIASMIVTNDSTIFIKMTGTKANIIKNKEAFMSLLKSFGLKSK